MLLSHKSFKEKKIAYLSSRLLRKCARLVQFKRFLKKIETATHMSCDAKSLSSYERYFKQFTRLFGLRFLNYYCSPSYSEVFKEIHPT